MKPLLLVLLMAVLAGTAGAEDTSPAPVPEAVFLVTPQQLQVIEMALTAQADEIKQLRARLRNGQGCL